MTNSDFIALGSCFVSIIAAAIAFYFANKTVKSNSAQIETSLRSEIRSAEASSRDAGYKVAEFKVANTGDLSAQQNLHLDFLSKAWNSSLEAYLNAYEDACGKYIDNKIDKKRFKKTYHSEIRNIGEKEVYKLFMQPESTSKYTAIWKVYKEWNNLER